MNTQRIIKNFIYTVAGGILSLGTTGCSGNKAETTDSFSTLEAQFSNPSSEYRTAPFMVWNGKVTEIEIDRMLKDFKDAGCGGAFIHPRPGMITEYMSDEWYSLYRYAVDKGKEMGLDIWIYDENSYPSGFAGGHVPEDMPESYNQGQGLELTKTDLLPDKTDEYFIILKKEGDKWADITNALSQHKKAKGEYYLYKKTYLGKSDWYGGYSYVDLLVPGVTEKFIDLTMKGYEKTIKDEFGKSVFGIFTDEPNISSPGGLRWTPDLFEVFRKQWGYDLKPLLPLLDEETGNWKQVRHNYMETLLQMFVDRWSKPWHHYCETNNLKWTGHYWEHGWPQMNDGPDNMAMYAWHQVPAIDMLFNQFDETNPQAQFGNIRAVKELRSAANQTGCNRTLSETYGGGGWDETFKDFKRLGDWEYALGVNFMNQHLAHMTLTGARKYDYPPVFTYHSPWWPDYRELNDYYGRLSFVMSKGIQKNDILVLEPNSTLWSYYVHAGSSPKLMEIGTNFQAFVTTLEKNQVEYDLGSENIIKDLGKVENGRFIVGNASYSTVVLPPMMETLNKPTFNLLQQFVEQGGQIITFSAPTRIDGAVNDELAGLLTGTTVTSLPELSKDVIARYFSSDNFRITFNSGNLYHHRRRFADGELVFLVNSSMDEVVDGTLSTQGKAMLEMDALNGEIYTYPSSKEKGILSTSFRIEPAGSLLLYCSDKNPKNYPERPGKAGSSPVTATSRTTLRHFLAQTVQHRTDLLPGKAPPLESGSQLALRLSIKGLPFTLAADKALDGLLALRQQGQRIVPQLLRDAPALQLLPHPAGAVAHGGIVPGNGGGVGRLVHGPQLLQPLGCILRQLPVAALTGQVLHHLLFRQHSAAGESGATGLHLRPLGGLLHLRQQLLRQLQTGPQPEDQQLLLRYPQQVAPLQEYQYPVLPAAGGLNAINPHRRSRRRIHPPHGLRPVPPPWTDCSSACGSHGGCWPPVRRPRRDDPADIAWRHHGPDPGAPRPC